MNSLFTVTENFNEGFATVQKIKTYPQTVQQTVTAARELIDYQYW